METFTFSCQISTTDPSAELGLEIMLDNQVLFSSSHIDQNLTLSQQVVDTGAPRMLTFCMSGKVNEHTLLSDTGEFVRNACLNVADLEFDGIPITSLLYKHSVYRHNFNGNGSQTEEPWGGRLGCNGTATLTFESPVYLWLLNNL
jgi:hypothetical protein